jgi:hypothetical protein
MRIRISSLVVWLLAAALLGLLLALAKTLVQAHADESIYYFSSDASNYFTSFQEVYDNLELTESPVLFLVGSPILFMKLSGGNLLLIQLAHLVLMAVSLRAAFDCFSTLQGRIAFLTGAFLFPYFTFGFLSLNKEIYAMCAAIFYGCWYLRGTRRHLAAALLLALCARYYMLVALLAMVVLVPRGRAPRWGLIASLLVVISLAAPLVKLLIPQYSSEDLLDVPSVAGFFFARAIDSFAYALVYPLKYLVLIPMRAYSYFIDSTRLANAMEGVVSIVSLAVLVPAVSILALRRRATEPVKRLVVLGLVAPMPIMWSEIMHWRYYSFVYFFFLYALVLHYVEGRRPAPSGAAPVRTSHA